jgi:hypothetical protein
MTLYHLNRSANQNYLVIAVVKENKIVITKTIEVTRL